MTYANIFTQAGIPVPHANIRKANFSLFTFCSIMLLFYTGYMPLFEKLTVHFLLSVQLCCFFYTGKNACATCQYSKS